MIERICKSCMQEYNLACDDMNEEAAEYCPFCGAHEDDTDQYGDPDQDVVYY
jgi:hypothetical protein